MEGEEIGRVLARASELRARISNCIDRSGGNRGGGGMVEDEEAEQEEEEEESLLGVCDALESLERQLAALHVSISLVPFCFRFGFRVSLCFDSKSKRKENPLVHLGSGEVLKISFFWIV